MEFIYSSSWVGIRSHVGMLMPSFPCQKETVAGQTNEGAPREAGESDGFELAGIAGDPSKPLGSLKA